MIYSVTNLFLARLKFFQTVYQPINHIFQIDLLFLYQF